MEETEITHKISLAKNLNRYFIEIGPTLAKQVDYSSVNFHIYLEAYNITQPEKELTVNKLKDAFFSLKLNKSPGYDDVSFNAIKKCLESLQKPLLHIFDYKVPGELKIARVTPSFKNGSDSDIGNYRQISVLPCFSKICGKIM